MITKIKNKLSHLCDTATGEKWKKIGLLRRAGILVPLFSVYSKDSIGIGDIEDLKLLIDFAEKTAHSIIQLLPMNEMGPLFCPYDSISSFALDPVYISLSKISNFKKSQIEAKCEEIRAKFPTGKPYLNYEIKNEKLKILWEMFLQNGCREAIELKRFTENNSYWVKDFALFKILKKYHQGKPWYEWREEYKNRDREEIEKFKREYEKEYIFEIWLQWQIYRQFKQAKEHAYSRKVLIKGDLPLLVSRDSADVWAHPQFFKLGYVSGAPPDMYCAKGQRWGMPPYNWENIAKDNYRYLKQKLKFSENFYDVLRIDHVVGLFRIWTIPFDEPEENKGLNGFYWPSDKNEWGKHGRNIISIINSSTNMFLCAEDLGTIPEVCTKTLKEFGIPGNDIQRWVKDWKVRHDFFSPREYRLLSVAALSNHDTTSWAGWWENEVGTVDEGLFIRKCSDHRQIGFARVKDKLFDSARSRYGRLRWLNSIDSVDKLVSILGKKKEELADFIDLYKDTYEEKEKLWLHLKLEGAMREKADPQILTAALKIVFDSEAIFSIQTLIDYLGMTDILKNDSHAYRINTPGTISNTNWSLVIPISLEDLLRHGICNKIKKMVIGSSRAPI